MAEIMNLSWKDFQASTIRTFQDLQTDEDFTDVTLACKDGKQVKAHKVILCSSSKIFKTILLQNPHQHPLIFLKDVQINVLKSLLQFIYSGNVEIDSDDLASFLVTAYDLQIEGLMVKIDNPKQQLNEIYDNINDVKGAHTNMSEDEDIENIGHENYFYKCGLCSEYYATQEDLMGHQLSSPKCKVDYSDTEGHMEVNVVKQEAGVEIERYQNYIGEEHSIEHSNNMNLVGNNILLNLNNKLPKDTINNLGDDKFKCNLCIFEANSDKILISHRRKQNKLEMFICRECNKEYVKLYSLNKHMLTHSTTKLACDKCNEVLANKASLDVHKKIHQSKKYPCFTCGRLSSTKSNLIRHNRVKHQLDI